MGPWGTLLLLLLLLGGSSSQEEGAENQSPTCPRDTTRFKHLRKYVYNYEAESANSVAGTADSHSATRINCKVELEVPQLCRFILKMSQCTLKEVYGFDPDGKALLRKTKNSDEFAAAMARDQLRLSIPDGKQVLLYPEKGEPAHILNIKRGVVSALLVPMDTEEDQRLLTLDTVYGNCSSDVTVRARKGNVATEILINRNLEKCDGFKPINKAASPIALIKGLGSPLSKLLSSQQECMYTLDPRKKHVVGAVCKEQHLFLPFSYKNQYGMMAHITQTLKLEDTPKTNSRFFDEDAFEKKGLALESSEAAAPTKEGGEVVLKTLEELQKLSALEQNEHRAKLFSRLVTGLRALNEEAFTSLWPKLLEVSSPLALQALVQCGQPQCYSHILHWLKTEKVNPLLIDAASYIMALTPNPSAQRLREIFKVAQERPSRITLYALSHVVNKFHRQTATVSQELKEVSDYLISRLGNECSGSEEAAYLTLRVIGNMGRTLEEVSPELKASLLKCIQSPTPSLSVQKAAIQALRKMELTEEVHSVLLQTFLDSASPEEKRLAAYLLLMRQPTRDTVHRVIPALLTEKSEQVRSFVVSHIANILVSEDLSVQDLRSLVKEALQDSQLPAAMDFRRFSQNYQFSKTFSIPRFSPFSTKVEGNLLFDPHNYLPKETMLKTTLSVFGFHPTDLFEVGLEGKGYEPTLEALFGKQGFFPDSATKALYWVDGRVPDPVSKVLVDHFGYTKEEKRDQDMVNGLMLSFQKLLKDLGSREAPKAQAYLRILGEELGYVRLEDFKVMGTALLRTVKSLQGLPQMIAEALTKGSKNDLFVHYIFMENTVEFPTGVGLPLQLSTSGLVTPGVMAGVKLQVTNMQAELVAKPSVSVEFVTHLGVTVPDFAWSGVQMNSNLYHESGLEARVALTKGQLKFAIPAPKNRVKLFKASNTLHLVSTTTYSKVIPPLIENRRSWSDCRPLFRGLNYCSTLAYSNASSIEAAPYYPLTGDTRFELELQPTGDVEEYTALVNYELQEEGRNLVDQLRFAVQAEGPMTSEATLTFKYHRSRMALTSNLQVPDLEVDFGTSLRIRDQSDEENVFYSLTLDVQDRKTTEATFTGHIRCDRKAQGTVGIVLSVPFLQAEARSETLVHQSSKKLLIQMDSSATALGTTISKKVAWRYDEKKLEFEWNMGTNTETKKLASRVLTEVSRYRGSLHQYSQDWLDRKVAHTDMTIRHIGSKLIAATNTWFQKASQGLPYAETLQRKFQSVQEWEMPEFQVPDNLFLKSDGRVRYTLNKNHVKVEIPLLFGGKSLEQLQLSRVIRTPALDLQAIGLQWPARELKLPPLTIPKSYPLQVPLLGILELSTNVYSNLYNWSASYTGGNTTGDTAQHVSFQSRYHMKANSALSLFSYSLQGSGETTYDHRNTFTLSCDGSLHHKFLDSNLKLSHVEKFGNNPASKGFLTLDASSGLGPQVSFSVHFDSKRKLHLYVKEIKADGQLRASSFHATSTYALSYQKDVSTGQISGESNLRLDSSFFQATNQVMGKYGDGSLSVTSVSNLQDGGIKNTASLTYENSQLTLKSDTTGKYSDLVAAHKLDLTLARQSALLRSEYQVDFQALKVFTLLSGSLNSRGLELNADLLGTDQSNSGAHKATVKIGQDGVSTSTTTNLKILPLMVENELNAALGPLGASLKVTTHARYQEHSAKYTLDGKAALTEVALGSVYQATILGTDSKDIFNFRINKEGLTLSNDMVGSYKETKLEHVNNLVIAGWSLDFTSEMENILSQNKLYQQSFSLQLQPYFLSATLNNNLRYGALDLANTGKLRLEPLKLSLGGNVKGTYGKEEIKHIYSLTYANLSASYKMDTVGKVRGTELTHRVSANLAGLASSIDINTAYNSESLRFSNIFRAMMEPFVLAVDAHTTGNGHLILGGKHTGQLYSKFLLKAEPLALTFSHDYKASSGHQLRSQRSIETTLDHKVNALFTPAEQSSTWKLKALANKNEYNHDLQAYNTKDRVGMELRAGAAADLTVLDSPIELSSLFNEPINVIDVFDLRTATDKPQEFSLTGSIKYDKNLNVHVINLPFLESLPAYFEKVRGAILATLQDLQRYLKSINIDHYVKQYRVALDKLPHLVNNLLVHFNFEGQVINAKEKLITFMENHKITVDDLQISLANAKLRLNEIVSQLQTYLIQFDQYIKDNYDLHKLKESIIELINKLKVFEENYKIHYHVMRSIQEVYEFLEKINVNKIRLMVWLRAQILEKLQQLNQQIQNIDFQYWADWLKGRVEDIDVRVYIEFLRTSLPIQELNNIVERIKEIVMNLLEDYEVIEKINAFRAKIHELTHKYEVHKRVQALLDKLVQLANQYKLKETTQKLTNSLKKMEIKAYFEKLRTLVDKAVKKAQTAKFEQLIDEVNKFLDLLVKTLRSFDYNQFVDEANKTIRELIQNINEEIQALELPQKIKAAKLYAAEVRAMLSDYLDKIKDTQLTVIADWFWDVMSSASVIDIKGRFQEILEDTRDRLYKLDIQREIHHGLQTISQVYNTLVTYIWDWWMLIAKELTDFAEQYHVKDWAESVKRLVEHGFTVPEIKTALGTLPAFEVSLRALQEATFQTPDFMVPLTDLRIPSTQINIKKLKEMRVASQFTTPEFSILNTFMVPSFTIDLIEIKLKIIRTIDQIMSSEFRWPLPEISLQDLKVKDTLLAALTLPDFHLPEVTIPEIVIPKLSLNEFQVPDIQIPEFQLPRIPHTVVIPTFGKVSAALKITSSFFTLDASGFIENTTTSERSPEILASMTAQGQSPVDLLDFTFQADAHFSAPEMERLVLKESLELSSKYLKAEHDSEMVFLGTSILGKVNTLANIHTDKNTMELGNSLSLKLEKQVTLDSNTKYSHKLNLPQADFSSQMDLRHELRMLLVLEHVAVTSTGTGSWKWAFPHFSDEGTHESLLRFTVEGPVASLDMSNTINSKHIKVNQKLASESGFLNFAKFEIQSEVQSQHVGQSVLKVRGSAMLGEMKAELMGTHDANLNGRVTGTLRNSLSLVVQPFEVGAEVNSEGNVKVSFPLKLTGKIDFLNNYALVLSCDMQQVSWQSGARFNQYRYSQNFSAGNNVNSLEAHVSINGEANLDFLNVPLTIPEMNLPYTKVTTPPLRDFSLWERTGLKDFLKTTKQSFDLSVNAQYKKNRDSHSILFPLGAVYDALNPNINVLHRHFEKGRDKTLDFLTKSYNEAKVKFEKHKVEASLDKLPRTLRIPGYYIPVLNIEVSPFTAELPAFGYMVPKETSTPAFTIPGIGFSLPSYTLVLPSLEFPVLHVPASLQKLSFPDFKIPRPSDHILIPAMGNLTYDFSFKSSVITLSTNMGLYNKSDIVAHFRSSSFSVIDALQYKLDGTTSLTRKRGLKLATALSLHNKFVEGNHDSTISLTKKNMEASVTTTAKVQCPVLRANFQQELSGNMKSKPIISSIIKLTYNFTSAQLHSSAKGAIDHQLTVESFIPYLSIETATKGSMSGSVLSQKYSGAISSEANSYLDTKSMRSSMKLEGTSKVDGIWNVEAKENFAGEASVGHIYTVWEHNGKNHLQLRRGFSTSGEQNSKVTLELAPWTASSVIQVQASQPSNLFKKASLGQVVTLTGSLKDQRASWKGEGHIQTASFSHNIQLSNDPSEIHLDVASSLEGYVSFLKDAVLPVYDTSLWDILKLDVTTSADRKQYLHISSALVYTKNPTGYQFSIPVKETADEFIIPGPELKSLVTPASSPESSYIRLAKKTIMAPFALSLPSLPQVKFPRVEVSTEYSTSEGSTLPFFGVTVPEFQVTLSSFTLPKKLPLAGAVLDLNEVANKIADFDLPSITMSEQSISVPTLTFWLPTGIFLPSFGALTGNFQAASPVYNTSWSANLKRKEDRLETTLEATCSSTMQLLEYDLDYGATYAFEDNILVGKMSGRFSHRELRAEYEDLLKVQGLKILEETKTFKVTSPTFTNVLMNYQQDGNNFSLTISSPPIGTLGLDFQGSPQVLQGKIYHRPTVSPERKLALVEMVLSQQSPEALQLSMSWNEETATELVQTLRAALHRAGETLYLYMDKCHREQTGLDIGSASSKLRKLLQKRADEAYHGALNQIDEAESGLRQAAGKAASTFQQWEDGTQRLYQAEQADFWDLKNKAFDGALGLTQEYHKKTLLLMDSGVELLQANRFQLPGQSGGYSGDELCSAVLREAGKALSRAYSTVHQAVEALISYVKDLDEKAAFLDLQKGLVELGERLEGFSDNVQHGLNGLQAAKFSDILISLQSFADRVFQQIEESITVLKEKTFTSLKNEFLDWAGLLSDLIPRVLRYLRENLRDLNSFVLTQFQEISRKLSQFHDCIKTLREEYFDPNIIGWTVKYYEIEDKLINLAKKIIDALKDFHSNTFESFLTWAAKLTDEVERLANTDVQKYLDLLRDADRKGKERLHEASMVAQESISQWASAAKRKAAKHREQFLVQLQGTSDGLSQAFQWATDKAVRLISLSVQGCHALLKYVAELLHNLQGATASRLNTYVQVHPGQLTINVPYRFH